MTPSTIKFFKALGVRALKTFCQTAVSLIPAAVVITAVDWRTVLGTAALSAICSALTSIATGLPEAE